MNQSIDLWAWSAVDPELDASKPPRSCMRACVTHTSPRGRPAHTIALCTHPGCRQPLQGAGCTARAACGRVSSSTQQWAHPPNNGLIHPTMGSSTQASSAPPTCGLQYLASIPVPPCLLGDGGAHAGSPLPNPEHATRWVGPILISPTLRFSCSCSSLASIAVFCVEWAGDGGGVSEAHQYQSMRRSQNFGNGGERCRAGAAGAPQSCACIDFFRTDDALLQWSARGGVGKGLGLRARGVAARASKYP